MVHLNLTERSHCHLISRSETFGHGIQNSNSAAPSSIEMAEAMSEAERRESDSATLRGFQRDKLSLE